MNVEAAEVVRETLMGIQPPGNPPSFKEVVNARTIGKGRHRQIIADMVMFDDRPAQVKLETFQWGWSVQWLSLPGGAISLEDGRWLRTREDDWLDLPLARFAEAEAPR